MTKKEKTAKTEASEPEIITPQPTALDIFAGVDSELVKAAQLQTEIQATAESFGLSKIDKIAGASKDVPGVIDFIDAHHEALRIYPIMIRRSRTCFEGEYDGENAKIICASEDSVNPVTPDIAILREFSGLQDGPCGPGEIDGKKNPGCRYQSFAWARSRDKRKPPCSIQVAILAVIQPADDPIDRPSWAALTILRAKGKSYGPAVAMLKGSSRLDRLTNGRRVCWTLTVKTDAFGKKGETFAIWSFNDRQLDEAPAYTDMFAPLDLSAGLERLLRAYWDKEALPEEWNSSTDDDDLPF